MPKDQAFIVVRKAGPLVLPAVTAQHFASSPALQTEQGCTWGVAFHPIQKEVAGIDSEETG